jgi:F-type H+-transporting ATPase subunit delta
MSDTSVAKRYAVALFQIAQEQNLLDQIEEEIRVIKEVFSNNQELLTFLTHPKVPSEKKNAFLNEVLITTSRQVQNTIALMNDRHRTDAIAAMAAEFIELANEFKSVAEAQVYSVRPLTEAEREAISASFAEKVGKKTLRIENIVDRSILGGIKLRIGNRIFDGSVSGKLERLEQQLLG